MNNDLSKLFAESAENTPEYHEALRIIKENSHGKVWLIGGFLFRTLTMHLYSTPRPEIDLDFIIEQPLEPLQLPLNWKTKVNHFGNFKLIGPKFEIDFIPLNNIHAIKSQDLSPIINDYLKTPPLTIQSIAFNVETNTLLGPTGINAIRTKTVGINNMTSAVEYASRYNNSVNSYIEEKAKSLNFTPIFPNNKY